jgi:dTDP-4-amino-4,6-dideoxygalactose transaminase
MSGKVPLVDLVAQYRDLRERVLPAMERVMEAGDFILGEEVGRFEAAFAAHCGVRHCVGVASGTDALLLGLRALGIRPGDEVVVPANTFVATALAVSHAGAVPVFADVCEDDHCLDPAALEAALTPRTRAVIPVHLYGQPARMDEILAIAARYRLRVLEDACQAHGARYRGAPAGSLGHAAAFSFYPGKNLGAYGDGGAVVTDDPYVADRLRLDRQYGQRVKYVHDTIGHNSRLDTLQAAVLRIKLEELDGWNARRRALADAYSAALAGTGLELPEARPEVEHVRHLYVVRTPARDALLARLHERGIGAGIHYPVPVHLQAPYRGARTVPEGAPVATRLAGEILSLPLYPEMETAQVERVAGEVRAFSAGEGNAPARTATAMAAAAG